jgi:hypothetical protein
MHVGHRVAGRSDEGGPAVKMIYLVGGPGAGKSTLMAALTAGRERLTVEQPVAHDLLIDPVTGEAGALEIGRRRPAFSGTDALASSIIERAVPWIGTRPARLVLGEGARLGNARFLSAAVAAGYAVTLAWLTHGSQEDWRRGRAAALGKEQNPSWVAGRVTASARLAQSPPAGVTVVLGHPDELEPELRELM